MLFQYSKIVAALFIFLSAFFLANSRDGKTVSIHPALHPGGRFLTYNHAGNANSSLIHSYDSGSGHLHGKRLFEQDWSKTFRNGEPIAGPDLDHVKCSGCHLEAASSNLLKKPVFIAKPVVENLASVVPEQYRTRRLDDSLPEARLSIHYVSREFHYPDGEIVELVKPVATMLDTEGDRKPVNLRVAPSMFGWGLLENIDQEMIATLHDPDDRNQDGISGRAMVDVDGGKYSVLGWKNNHSTVHSQVVAALANDIGVRSSSHCHTFCKQEITDDELAALVNYVRFIGVPQRRFPESQKGQDLFGLSGCATCHMPALVTKAGNSMPLAKQTVWPYSDLLLHDMGSDLADKGDAENGSEWRTTPLWGVGILEVHAPRRGYLHDGRARTLEEAVLWHGGEAEASKQYFVSLTAEDRNQLLSYVRTL